MRDIYAGTIEEGTWRYLDLLSHESNLKKTVKTQTAASQISFSIRQAKEYYAATKQATMLTKPVLLYYGILNLAKALILYKNQTVGFVNLKTHGLVYQDSLKNTSLFNLSCQSKGRSNSVFFNLLNVVDRDRYSLSTTIDGKGAKQEHFSQYSTKSIFIGEGYKISDLLVLVSDLYEVIIEATRLTPKTVPISQFTFNQRIGENKNERIISNGFLKLRHGRHEKMKQLIKKFENKGELKDWTFLEDRWDIFEYKIPNEVKNFSFPNIRETIFREQTGIFLSNKKLELPEIIIHFILMFILGSAARYSPFVWWKLIGKNIGENKVIESFLDSSQIKFPLLILREFRDELIYFRQA